MNKKVCIGGKEYTLGTKKVKETGMYEVVVKNEYGEVQDWDISQTEHETIDDAEQSILDWFQEYCIFKPLKLRELGVCARERENKCNGIVYMYDDKIARCDVCKKEHDF